MADENQPAPETIEKARRMGWVPQEEFHGDKTKWRGADEYVARGEEMLPIIKANERKLLNEVGTLRGQLAETRQLLAGATESIEALKEFNSTANLTKVKEHKQDIIAGIVAAKKDEDVAREVELTDQLSQANLAIREAETKPKEKAAPTQQQQPNQGGGQDPVLKAWAADNTWFGHDRRKSALALGIRDEMHAQAQAEGRTVVQDRAFYDSITTEVNRVMGGGVKPHSSVEGGGNGSGSGGGGGTGKLKTFASLPADAKAACEKLGARLIGKGKAYKDSAEWQAAYTKKYFEQEA